MGYTIENVFDGYQNYEETEKKLRKFFDRAFGMSNPYFMIAVNEAVCNAARYSVDGMMQARIFIKVVLSENDLSVKVSSKTRPFNAEEYQQTLKKLAADPKLSEMDWGEYTAATEISRGFWYMLEAVDYLVVESDGSEVTLSARIPYRDYHPINTKIGFLVPRFFVKKNGVIK